MTAGNGVESLVSRIEQAEVLDQLASRADPVAAAVGRGALGEALRGGPLGHPLHPALVALPIGGIATAVLLDLTGADPAAARRALGIGLLAAPPTALAGWADWGSTTGAARRVGVAHAAVNVLGLALCAASWARRPSRGRLLSAAGVTVMGAAAFLGGHLAYRLGVGVDTGGTA
ncbi:MAG TPA: DUF2231 domain-containing protein [Dermatophilaceae bacterium]|nr:DUF2231 domain-containing protein [Dermatophilaceae bacterium]